MAYLFMCMLGKQRILHKNPAQHCFHSHASKRGFDGDVACHTKRKLCQNLSEETKNEQRC